MRSRLGLGLVVAVLVAAGVHVLLRATYWDYSEGVYALSAHLMLHGSRLYDGLIGAQPPGVFLYGAASLVLHGGLEWLRAAVAALQVAAGVLAGVTVWRLTRRPVIAILTPAALLLTPWAVREHGALLPELVGLPLLLSMPLVDAWWALGLLAGALLLIKLSFVLPVAAVLIAERANRRAPLLAAAVFLAGLGLATVLGGVGMWRDVFYAQSQTGIRTPGSLVGYWAQAVWNLAGLLVLVALAIVFRDVARDRPLLVRSFALAAGALLSIATTFKQGTSLNVLVPVEASLVPLAACGVSWGWSQRSAGDATVRSARRWIPAAMSVLAVLWLGAQAASLLVSPRTPRPFIRPGSGAAWAAVMTRAEFQRATDAARRCPPRAEYTGPPIIAFAAGRMIAGGQPDQFIVTHARTFRGVAVAAGSAARCG